MIIEITLLATHGKKRTLEHFLRKREGVPVEVGKLAKRYDALGDRVDVDGPDSVVEVLRAAVRREKVEDIEAKPLGNEIGEFLDPIHLREL